MVQQSLALSFQGGVCNKRPDPSRPAPNVGSAPDSRFLRVFGVSKAAASTLPRAQPGPSTHVVAGEPAPPSPVHSASTVPMDRDEEGIASVVLCSQPPEPAGPVAGEGEQPPAEMAVDHIDEPVPLQQNAVPQVAAQSEGVVVAVMEETRQAGRHCLGACQPSCSAC